MNPQAPNNDSSAASDLSRVQALLPLHAQGLLQGEQRTFMNQWLEHNMAQYPEIKADLAWLGTTATQLKTESAAHIQAAKPQLDAGLAVLMGRINAEQASQASAAAPRRAAIEQRDWLASIIQWFNDTLGVGSRGLVMGAAVLVFAQAGVIGALWTQPAQQTVLSGAPALPTSAAVEAVTVLTLAFKPNATELQIRQTLANANAQLSSGPSALGLYNVTVATAQLDASLLTLRAATGVVESVTR
jgi:hypothetical protein